MRTNAMDPIYSQNAISRTAAYDAVNKTAAAKDGQAAAEAVKGSKEPNTDRVEFSQDTKVITKMSADERAALVKSLKDDLENQTSRFTSMMMQMFQKQGITGLQAGSDAFWRKIASGDFTVDAKTKAEAQQAISEDGYWGVKQTSQRIFDFAQALAGDDPEKMKKMQEAVEKGFGEAKKSWGGEMPSITGDTYRAVKGLFDDYYQKTGKTEKTEE